MLPFVMLPRPLQESGVVGKGGSAGFLGRAYDPYLLYPPGDDMDMSKMERIKTDDLQAPRRKCRRTGSSAAANCEIVINEGMPAIEEATAKYDLDEYYGKALGLVISGRARKAFDAVRGNAEHAQRYGLNTFGQSCLLARRLIEAGTRFVEVNWPKVANSDNHSWDVHAGLTEPHEGSGGADARRRLLGADRRPRSTAACCRRRWLWRSASSAAVRSAASALPATTIRTMAAIIGRTATRASSPAPCVAAWCTASPTRRLPLRWRTPYIRANCWRRSITASASIRRRWSSTTSINRVSWSRASQ